MLVIRPFFQAIDRVIHEYGDYLMIPFAWGALALIAFILFRKRRPKSMIVEVRLQVEATERSEAKPSAAPRRSEPGPLSRFEPWPKELGDDRRPDRN